MKRLITTLAGIGCCLLLNAQPSSGNIFTFSLHDNYTIQIEVCSNEIIHLHSANGSFSQSLMERYGILKVDWPDAEVQSKNENGNQIIQTAQFQLVFNQVTGELLVKDVKGNTIINSIRFIGHKDLLYTDLSQSLENYFGKSKSGGGIIGDTAWSGTKNENVEITDPYNSSVIEISLNKNERFYGAGSASRDHIQHRGSALKIWASYQKSEAPMPFLMSSAGWGIFNNTTLKNYFDVGRYNPDKLFLYTTAEEIDFYLMLGDNMVDVIEQYTTLTGKPYLLPRWAYGLAFGSNILENQFNVLDNALRFRKEQIPCDIYWLEPQWMKKTYDFSTQKEWNTDRFQASYEWMNDPANPKATNLFISRMNDLGFKTVLWLCADHDLTIEEEDNLSVRSGQTSSGMEHWFPHLNKFVDQGIAGFKLDPGRTLDEHPAMKYYNGKTDAEMHNLNQVLLQKQMYRTFREHTGMRSFHHYCGGYAGSQHWGAATVGDNGGNIKSLYDIINQSFTGNSNVAVDALEDVAIKGPGIHYAFFTPWVQVNSWAWLLHPWYYNEHDKMLFRFYAQLRYSLLPYIYSSAVNSSITGQPIVWPMALAYPEDSLLTGTLQQYMFGESLLVGAFTNSIRLPEGSWIDYWTGTTYTGKQWINCQVPENRGGPLFIKTGAIIPCQKPTQYTGAQLPDTLIVKVYPDKQNSYELLEDDGISFGYENGQIAATRFDCDQSGKAIHFHIHPVNGTYKGMSGTRTYLLEFYFQGKPRQVWVNNKKTRDWKFDAGKLSITIQQGNRSEKQMITIL